MDVDAMVGKWVDAVAGMTLAHSKDEVDRWEFVIEELLTPLLAAPVRQIRLFWTELAKRLEADRRIPFFLHTAFRAWSKVMIEDAPDEGVLNLKTKLAEEIAALVEQDVKGQLPEAIMRALQWRPAEKLEAIKEELKKGTKPKLQGRESCLFLVVGDEAVML